MKKVAFTLLALAYVAALGTITDGQTPDSGDGPRYVNKVNLVRPPDYREWVFVSSGLGMEYNPVAGTPGRNAFGNVFVNPKDLHSGEFGAKLIYWSMQQTGTKPVTGKGGALATDAAAHPEKSYRVLMFDGCRTQDYVKSVRSTPGFDPRSTDIVSTKRSIYLKDEFAALAAFLDASNARRVERE